MALIVGPTLPEPYYGRVASLWTAVADEFGDNGITNPYPHFTLYGLDEGADVGAVVDAVRDVAARHGPFTVHTDGAGVFPGDHVWLPVAKSRALLELHEDTVERLDGLGTAPTPFYEPHRWFPHVAVALNLDAERAGRVATLLLGDDLDWAFEVDTVAITRPPAGEREHDLLETVAL